SSILRRIACASRSRYAPISRFSRTRKSGNVLSTWGTYWMPIADFCSGPRRVMSSPLRITRPSNNVASPYTVLRKVLLPLPFGPTRATSSFGRSSIETPWTTTAFPYPPTMSRARRAGSTSLPQVSVDHGRVLDGGFRLPVEEDFPLVHDQHSLHVIEEDLEPMLDDDEREAVFLTEPDDRLEDFLRQLRRDAGRRLIEEQEPRAS